MDKKLVGNVLSSQDSMLTAKGPYSSIKQQTSHRSVAYRQKFMEIQDEMKELRSQMSEQRMRLKRDKTILMLEEERDWYREELQKADTRMKKLEAANKKLQGEYSEAVADRNGLYTQILTRAAGIVPQGSTKSHPAEQVRHILVVARRG